MRPQFSPDHHWISNRIRLLCCGIFFISLFLPPYSAETEGGISVSLEHTEIAYDSLVADDGFLMKTSSITEQGSRSTFSQGIIHTVEANESIASIAKDASISIDTILWANGLTKNSKLVSGQKLLLLPIDGIVHKVKRGQNLKAIAELYDVPTEKIGQQNKLKGGYLLAGQELIIPGGKPLFEKPVIAKTASPKTAQPTKPAQKPTPKPPQQFTPPPSYGILQKPCGCFYTQNFNGRHFGIDLQQRGGGPNFAAEAGTVIRADYGWNGGYGNVIVIDHGNGLQTLYAHNKVLYVTVGETVTRGQTIAWMGNTGLVHGPTGIHLHFEVHVNGVKRNPSIYIQD